MAQKRSAFFGPSEVALEFGAQYAEVLARWGELFGAASALVDANVKLGRMTKDASTEFEEWIQQTANAPWNWLNPEVVQRFMRNMPGMTANRPSSAP
ncbi:hypothetical protein AYO38_01575 [bacterium SCGC AG-212-C10]|nr:hypothetical protein AYO38_01575 [bacterium SCGC AG-212-C10]